MSLVVFKQLASQLACKPTARPQRLPSRDLNRYNLTAAQRDHLERYRFLPKNSKLPRPTNMNRATNPPDQIELNFLGTSAGERRRVSSLRCLVPHQDS